LIDDLVAFNMRMINWITSDGIGMLVKAMTRLGDALVDWIIPMLPKLLDKLKEYAKTFVSFLLDTALPNLVDNVQILGDKLVGWIGEAARKVPAQLVTFLGEMAGWLLSEAVPKLLEIGLQLLGSLLKWTLTLGKDLIIGLGGALVALVAVLPDLFMGFIKGLGNIAVNAVQFFIDKFKMLGGKIAELAVGAVNFLIEQFNKIPLIPNIDKITIDTTKLTGAMGLTAAEVSTVSASFGYGSKYAGSYSSELGVVAKQTAGAKTSTEGLNTALGGGGAGGGGGGGGGTSGALNKAQEQLKKYTSALQTNEDRSRSVTDATKNVGKAHDALKVSIGNVEKAQTRFNLVIGGFPRTSKEAIEATKQLDQANRRLRDSNIAQEEAVRGVASAEKRLADLRALTSDPANVADAERNLTRAKFGIEQANFDVIEAERELSELRATPDANPIELRKREIGLEEAKFRVIEATIGQTQATKQLDDERNRAAKPEDIADAERDLEAAKLAVVDAIDETRDATIEQSEAQDNLNEVLNGAKEGSDAYKEALDALTEAKDKQVDASERVTEALERERDAVRELAEAQRELLELQKSVGAGIRGKAEAAFAKFNTPINPTGTTTSSQSAISTPAAVGDTNINFNIEASGLSTPADIGAEVIDALAAYLRTNGNIPINVGSFVGTL